MPFGWVTTTPMSTTTSGTYVSYWVTSTTTTTGTVTGGAWDGVYYGQMANRQAANTYASLSNSRPYESQSAFIRRETERQAAALVRGHKQEAQDRARELLIANLTPDQQETFTKNKWFVVEGSKSKKRYRIRDCGHMVANVDVLDGEKVSHRLCCHAGLDKVPVGDHLLAQKLMLDTCEEEFISIANRHAA